ncbi:MAG: dialkylresorcinol condensing enzyme DarA [Flavobacterium sp.]|nr:dialkylresorcinol condensing enzyme DarA [Flavobacterium sp.]
MKNILVLYYTQSGQLKDIADNLVAPLQENCTIDYCQMEPEKPFPFPWSNNAFFNVFPETFSDQSVAMKPIAEEILNKDYDLVILAYQIWFLSPSIPAASFLNSTQGKQLLQNKKVVTVIGCRNMWIMAQERLKEKLKRINADLVGNIVLRDRNPNHISVLTIVHWLFYGKKTRMFGFLPLPGVSDQDIKNTSVFGEILKTHVATANYDSLQSELIAKKAVEIKPFLLTVEKKATRIFGIWSNLITKNPAKRSLLLTFFNFYLWFAIWVVSPLVFLIYLLLYFFNAKSLQKEIKYYQSV